MKRNWWATTVLTQTPPSENNVIRIKYTTIVIVKTIITSNAQALPARCLTASNCTGQKQSLTLRDSYQIYLSNSKWIQFKKFSLQTLACTSHRTGATLSPDKKEIAIKDLVAASWSPAHALGNIFARNRPTCSTHSISKWPPSALNN